MIGSGSPTDERLAFNTCLEQFLGLYNISAAYQSVENPHGHAFFDKSSQAAAQNARSRN